MADTTTKGFPYPEGPDPVDVAGDIQALAEAVDDMPGVQSYTGAEIAALAVGEKWAGRVVWNSTTGKLQVSNGSTFSDVDTSVALSSSTPQTLGTAAAGTSSDASRADHRHAMPSASDVGAIGISLVTAAGQVIASTGSATPAVVTAGTTDGHILTWDSAVSTKMKWAAAPASGIPATLLDAKGDLIVASAADTAARLAVGTNGHALLADSGAATGVKWGAVGKVLQVVSTLKDDTFSSATGTTYTDITGLSATITPTATTSKILVLINMYGQSTAATANMQFQIVRGSTAIGNGAAAGNRDVAHGSSYQAATGAVANMTGMFLDSPSTTSSTTYKVQGRCNTGASTSIFINRAETDTDSVDFGRFASSITLLEIAA